MQMLRWQFARFLLVGIINTAFSYGVYAFFVYLGLNYAVANLLALLIGIVFSFKTQGKFVFRAQSAKAFLPFVLCWVVIYVFNIALIGVLIKIGFNAYAAGAIALAPVVVFSYFLQRYVVFRRPAGGKDAPGPAAHDKVRN